MSALFPSFRFQKVTRRHQLKWTTAGISDGDGLSTTELEPEQPVTYRNRLNRSSCQLVTDRLQFQSVTNCNQLTRIMRQFSLWLATLTPMSACKTAPPTEEAAPREVHTPTYNLLIPAEQKALLVLFPCFPCDAADTRAESRIADRGTAAYL